MTSDDSTDPRWRGSVYPWLDSEYLDSDNALRFRPGRAEFHGASWPLMEHSRDGNSSNYRRLNILDLGFDDHVKCAWRLPWQMSKLRIDTPERRSQANFSIRNIGYWNGEPGRYDQLLSPLTHCLNLGPIATVHNVYALTPFCVIAQQWTEAYYGNSFPAQIVHTHILLFYTFETFIQECLALDADRLGRDADAIVEKYQHVYTNSRSCDFILSDPARLPLAAFAGSSWDWEAIRTSAATAGRGGLMDDPERHLREWRVVLFSLRLQAHLMVAITVALRGLQAFNDGRAASALVRPMTELPQPDQLAPFWMGHTLGAYDYALESEKVLIDLAQRCGNSIDPKTIGGSFQTLGPGTTTAEESIRFTTPPGFGGRHGAPSYDFFRWALFEPSLDDQSMEGWINKMRRLEAERYGM